MMTDWWSKNELVVAYTNTATMDLNSNSSNEIEFMVKEKIVLKL